MLADQKVDGEGPYLRAPAHRGPCFGRELRRGDRPAAAPALLDHMIRDGSFNSWQVDHLADLGSHHRGVSQIGSAAGAGDRAADQGDIGAPAAERRPRGPGLTALLLGVFAGLRPTFGPLLARADRVRRGRPRRVVRVLTELGLQPGHPIPQRLVLRDQLNQTTLQLNDPLGQPHRNVLPHRARPVVDPRALRAKRPEQLRRDLLRL